MLDFGLRCKLLAKNVLKICRVIPNNVFLKEYISQLARSSSSVGANYIEANEALSYKDCLYRLKIARKEAKETLYWLEILEDFIDVNEKSKLTDEVVQILKILSTMIKNKKNIPNEF